MIYILEFTIFSQKKLKINTMSFCSLIEYDNECNEVALVKQFIDSNELEKQHLKLQLNESEICSDAYKLDNIKLRKQVQLLTAQLISNSPLVLQNRDATFNDTTTSTVNATQQPVIKNNCNKNHMRISLLVDKLPHLRHNLLPNKLVCSKNLTTASK